MNREQLTDNRKQGTVKSRRPPCTSWLIVLAVIVMFAGCKNLFEPEKRAKAEEYGTFTLEVGGLTVGRTILPETAKGDFAMYTLVFSSSGMADVSVDCTNATLGEPVTLAVGTWELAVTAYMDSGKVKPAARGSATGITINAGTNVNQYIELYAIIEAGSSGVFLWDIDYPDDVTSARMTVTPLDMVTGTAEQVLYFIGGTPLINKNNSAAPLGLKTGYYRVVFSLSNGEHSTGREEYLHIYQNMESRFEHTFTRHNFTVYSVTSGADSGPGSLRHAITHAANGNTIFIEDGVTAITLESQLVIDKSLTIEGNGVVLTAGDPVQLLHISGNSTAVTMRRLHFKDGEATDDGAAVYNSGAHVTLESCIFSGNQTASSGGAVFNAGTMSIKGCTFYGNSAEYRGGAIYNSGGGSMLALTGNLFWGNTAGNAANGHAVYRINGTVTSGGWNVSDDALVANPQGGWVAGTGDATFASLEILGTPIDAGFALLPRLCTYIPTAPTDFPAADFYGNIRTFPGAPGASAEAAPIYTVTFDANGASGTVIAVQEVLTGSGIALPDKGNLDIAGFSFGGWYTNIESVITHYDSGDFTPTGNITLYAQWYPDTKVPGTSLADKLAWLQTGAQNNTGYIIYVSADETIAISTLAALAYAGKSGVVITIESDGTEKTIDYSYNGSLFTVGNGVTLVLGFNIALQGHAGNTASLVQVQNGGTLEMYAGSRITGNFNSNNGGGISVDSGGVFVMHGGDISGNASSANGGGIYTASGGTLVMHNGTVSGNSASNGSGVYAGGTFTMHNGTVTGNTNATNGGGVYVGSSGTFTMHDGEISDNGASNGGGMYTTGNVTMVNGNICGNESDSSGGGAYVGSGGTFTMYSGEITGNNSITSGGGLFVGSGTFTIHNGEISDNTSGTGGGMYTQNGTIRLVGGTIYGSTEEASIRNTAGSGASLLRGASGTVQYGKLNAGTWNSNGSLDTTNDTIRIIDGMLCYIIAFEANGGTPIPESPIIVAHGEKIRQPDAMSKTGYAFIGWYTEAICANEWNFDHDAVSGYMTLYAKWLPTYAVTLSANGGTPPPASPITVTQGDTIPQPDAMTRTGYTFDSWYKEAGFINKWTFSSDTVMGATALYARWIPINYDVTYNANNATGGTPPTDLSIYHIGHTVTALGNTGALVRTGYTFTGWNTSSYGTDTNYVSGSAFTMGAENIILYAQWSPISYNITYNANYATGGTVPTDSNIYHIDHTVTVLGNPGSLVRYGYTFAGWNTASNGTGTSYVSGSTFTMGAGNITLYAHWLLANEMVWINAGTFTMGDPLAHDANPPHKVTLTNGYYMGKYEVTQELYETVTGVNPSNFASSPASGEIQGKRPVERVTWFDAVEFCNTLSGIEGLTPVYTFAPGSRVPATGYPITSATVTVNWNASGYRLPTEAEWEYACRAGTSTAWSFGNTESQLVNYAWYTENSNSMTHEAGKKLPNAWGLYDMHGNVWERCWDQFELYGSGDQVNPVSTSSWPYRVLRGGSYNVTADLLHSACRIGPSESSQGINIGFRLARGAINNPSASVFFNADGGIPAPTSPISVTYGEKIPQPPTMTRKGYNFVSWYKEASCTNQWNFASDTVTGNTTLYAKWEPITNVPGQNLAAKLRWLYQDAPIDIDYKIDYKVEVNNNESIDPTTLSRIGKEDIGITIVSTGSPCTITMSNFTSGSMFIVENGVTLILQNITLKGKENNTLSLITVNSCGTLVMKSGSSIIGNSATYGGGVYVMGTFNMEGGSIENNESFLTGGGVDVHSNGRFTMSDGFIANNRCNTDVGGGVSVNGYFTMNGGQIHNNFALNRGGGVYIDSGTFLMKGGHIRNNKAQNHDGGGVFVHAGTFIMDGGGILWCELYNNYAGYDGGGVYVDSWGTFLMDTGTIHGVGSNDAGRSGDSLYKKSGGTAQYGNITVTSTSWSWARNGDFGTMHNEHLGYANGVKQ